MPFASFVMAVCMIGGGLTAGDGDTVAATLAELTAADAARSAAAAESTAWAAERVRLEAASAALEAEAARLTAETVAITAEATAIAARTPPDVAGSAAMAQRLAAVRDGLRAALVAAATNAVPGTVRVPAVGASLDEVLRCLADSERAATQVAVGPATGLLDGRPAAVRLLRCGGAVAWWEARDGSQAGVVMVESGQARLVPLPAHAAAIRAALAAVAEGHAVAPLVLPLAP